MTENCSHTALLVIDVQASFPHRPYWRVDDVSQYLAEQNRLISGCIANDIPVIRVFHVEPSGVFSLASGFVKPLDGLVAFEAAFTLQKVAHSAFSGTPLASRLLRKGISRLIISGIRTEQCCETTTRCASDLGFAVDYVTAATLTFPMKHSSGQTFTCDEIKMRTELVLEGRFAHIVSVDEALQRATAVTKAVAAPNVTRNVTPNATTNMAAISAIAAIE